MHGHRLRFALLPALLGLAGCQRQELLQGLDQRQANQVVAALQRQGIDSEKLDRGKAGYSVGVDRGDFGRAVERLQLEDLPSPPQLEITQLFPSDTLVSSPRAEKARLNSALEQRLGQILRNLDHVLSAHVQLSYALDDPSGGVQAPAAHAAVLLVSEPEADPELLIQDAQRMLKNSFSSMDYANISVVVTQRHAQPWPQPVPAQRRRLGAPLAWGAGAACSVLPLAGLALWKRRRRRPPSS